MTSTVNVEALPSSAHLAGLRSRLITRLTGLSPHQVRYWHESGLLEASLRPGHRGVPRLYSWVDYLRLQVAAELERAQVPTTRTRRAIAFLDEHLPDWYLLPTRVRSDSMGHVRVRTAGAPTFVADAGGQFTLDVTGSMPPDVPEAGVALSLISKRGPLCLLSTFDDAVFMDPTVNLAQPSVVETALETRFVAGIASEIGVAETAVLYRLDLARLRRVIEFEGAVA